MKNFKKSIFALAVIITVFAAGIIIPAAEETNPQGQEVAFIFEDIIECT